MFETSIRGSRAAGMGLAAGLIFGWTALSFSQEQGAQLLTGPDAGVSALQAQIAALTKRIDDLEKAEKEPKKAPFTVADAAGKPIFTVAAEGRGAGLYLYGPTGTISLNASDRLSLLLDSGGASSATLTAEGDGPSLVLRNGDASVVAGADGGAMSLVVQQGTNKVALKSSEQASLAIDAGGGSAYIATDADGPSLLLHKGESNIVAGTSGGAPTFEIQKGSNKVTLKSSEQASLSVDSGDGSAYIATDSDGPSLLLHKGDANISAGKSEGAMSFAVQNGQNSTELSASGAGASVSVDEAGRSVKLGSADSTFGLSALVDDARVAALGDRGDGTYSLRVYQEGASLPVLQAGVLASGDPGLVVGDGTDQFVRIEGKGDEGVVRTYKGGTETVTLGNTEGGSGLFVSVDNQSVSAQISGSDGPEISIAQDGYDAFRVDTRDRNPGLVLADSTGPLAVVKGIGGSGSLSLAKDGKRTITLGPTIEKLIPAVRAYDEGGKMVFAAGAVGNGRGIALVYGGDTIAADMAGTSDGGSITAYHMEKPVASINSTDKAGEGLVVVRSGSGTAVATLGYGSSGGGNVTVSDPSGNGVFSAGYDGGDGPGSACVEHKGTKCLGVGLTGMEGMH